MWRPRLFTAWFARDWMYLRRQSFWWTISFSNLSRRNVWLSIWLNWSSCWCFPHSCQWRFCFRRYSIFEWRCGFRNIIWSYGLFGNTNFSLVWMHELLRRRLWWWLWRYLIQGFLWYWWFGCNWRFFFSLLLPLWLLHRWYRFWHVVVLLLFFELLLHILWFRIIKSLKLILGKWRWWQRNLSLWLLHWLEMLGFKSISFSKCQLILFIECSCIRRLINTSYAISARIQRSMGALSLWLSVTSFRLLWCFNYFLFSEVVQ